MYRYLTVWAGRYIVRNHDLEFSERKTILAIEHYAGKITPFKGLVLPSGYVTIYVRKTEYDGSRRWVAWMDGEKPDFSGRLGSTRDKAVRNLLIALAQRVEIAKEVALEIAYA